MLTKPALAMSPKEALPQLVQGIAGILYIMGRDDVFFKVMEVIHGPVQVTAYGGIVTYIICR